MKKTFTLLSIISFLTITAFSQNLTLSYSGGSLNNGDTITITSTNNTVSYALNIYITNIGNAAIDIKAKKTEINTVSGSNNSFCDWTSCYDPTYYESPTALTLNPSDTNKSFTGDYKSKGNPGKSTIMYTFFNTHDDNDSAAVIVNFIAGSSVGIESNKPKIILSNAYPNPVKDAFYLDYNFSEANTARVEVINVIGSVVKVQNIQDLNGKTRIDISNLNNGVYFYRLIVDGKKYVSKKLIVQK